MRYAVALLVSIVALNATAEVRGVVQAANGASIRVTDEQRMCLGDSRYAEWVSKDATARVPGCWLTDGRVVFVSFLDGERADIPVPLLRKPTSL